MPVQSWAHSQYWSGSTGPPPPDPEPGASGAGAYPAWQSVIVTAGIILIMIFVG